MSKCYWCGKPSTRLCDFPVGGEQTTNEKGEKVMNISVCSKPICDECATKYHGMDVCPKCLTNVTAWALKNKDKCLELLEKRRAKYGKI